MIYRAREMWLVSALRRLADWLDRRRAPWGRNEYGQPWCDENGQTVCCLICGEPTRFGGGIAAHLEDGVAHADCARRMRVRR